MKIMATLFTLALVTSCGFAQGEETGKSTKAKLKPVPVKSGAATLAPANTQINFVGVHEGAKPDPRKGGFTKFTGKAHVADDGMLKSVSLDIDTTSLATEIPKLTAHLKSADFFDVREHPQARFESTSISATDKPGTFEVTGKFTLLGKTKEIKIPATVAVTSAGLTLQSEFTIDRTQFGMTYGVGKVKNDVNMSVAIGIPTKAAGK